MLGEQAALYAVKTAASVDTLQAALKRIGVTRLNRKSSWLGPHLNQPTGRVMMPSGGAVKNMDIWDMPRPSTPAGQKATNILGGMHEGFERSAVGRGETAGFHGHASPRVLLDENNMLAALHGSGAEEAKKTFGAIRGAESPEAQEITQAVHRLSGGRMPFTYGETKLPAALKQRLSETLRTR